MKKLFFALLAAPLVLAGCSNDDDKNGTPTLSLSASSATLTQGSVTLNLEVRGLDKEALEAPVEVPVVFSGSAVEEEYTASADRFVVGGADESLSIEVTTEGVIEAKELIATLQPVSGFVLKNASVKIALEPIQPLVYSFVSNKAVMSNSVEIQLEIFKNGSWYKAEKQLRIPVAIDTDRSTAVEGTHFEFAGDKEIVIEQGQYSGTVTLHCLQAEADYDMFVLKADVEGRPEWVAGNYSEVAVAVFGSYFDRLTGTWKMSETGHYDRSGFLSAWGISADSDQDRYDAYMAAMPAYNANDRLIFSENGLTTSLESTLKNFFKAESAISNGGELPNLPINANVPPTRVDLQQIVLADANRYFSATEQSEDTEAYIGVSFVDGDSDRMLLCLIDYEPKSFLTEEFSWMDFDTKPTMTSAPVIYFEFVRVTE